jgi:hypothetical protein
MYKSVGYADLSALQAYDLPHVDKLNIRAATEIRKFCRQVEESFEAKILNSGVHKSFFTDPSSPEWAQFSTLFDTFYNNVILDILTVSKNLGQLVAIQEGEGIYAEAANSKVVVLKGTTVLGTCTVTDILNKSLSGVSVQYVPPGSTFVDGALRVTDRQLFVEALAKASSGVSGGISPTVKPAGPPKESKPANPGSVAGVPAPNQPVGPGRGENTANAPKAGVEYDNHAAPGTPEYAAAQGKPGWEESQSGGLRHRKGVTGPKASAEEEEGEEPGTEATLTPKAARATAEARGGAGGGEPVERHNWNTDAKEGESTGAVDETAPEHGLPPEQDLSSLNQGAIEYGGRTDVAAKVALNHLTQGTIASIKQLGDEEAAGIQTSFRVAIEENGRALMKPTVTHDPTAKPDHSTGIGSVPRNSGHNHEVAAYNVYTMLGSDLVPPTATRSHKGVPQSMQKWMEEHAVGGVYAKGIKRGPGRNTTRDIIRSMPGDKQEELIERMHSMITVDLVINHNDRHRNNALFNEKGTMYAIDNTDAFGTGMKGTRNTFHYDLQRSGGVVTIPETLKTNLKNKSLGDYKRGLGDNLPDWQVGQTYLRGQYVLHLQETEGHLDVNKFLPTLDAAAGGDEQAFHDLVHLIKGEAPQKVPVPQWRSKTNINSFEEFDKRKADKTLPNDLFEAFSKKWIDDNKSNPASANHETAKELDEMGVFMPAAAMMDPSAYRKTGKHREYENTITGANPKADIGHLARHNKPAQSSQTALPDPQSSASVQQQSEPDQEGTNPGFKKRKRT